MELFSRRLKYCRNKKGLTQAEFSKVMGIPRSTVSGYETEDKEPDMATIVRFAEFFGVSTDWLLGKSEDPNRFDAVVTRDGEGFKAAFDALSASDRAAVSSAVDAFYSLLYRDVSEKNSARLELFRRLFVGISEARSEIKSQIASGDVSDPVLLLQVMGKENDLKTSAGNVLDALLQSDLAEASRRK